MARLCVFLISLDSLARYQTYRAHPVKSHILHGLAALPRVNSGTHSEGDTKEDEEQSISMVMVQQGAHWLGSGQLSHLPHNISTKVVQ
jgi:hypothetical protein